MKTMVRLFVGCLMVLAVLPVWGEEIAKPLPATRPFSPSVSPTPSASVDIGLVKRSLAIISQTRNPENSGPGLSADGQRFTELLIASLKADGCSQREIAEEVALGYVQSNLEPFPKVADGQKKTALFGAFQLSPHVLAQYNKATGSKLSSSMSIHEQVDVVKWWRKTRAEKVRFYLEMTPGSDPLPSGLTWEEAMFIWHYRSSAASSIQYLRRAEQGMVLTEGEQKIEKVRGLFKQLQVQAAVNKMVPAL